MKKIKVPRVVNGIDTLVEIEVEDKGGAVWGPRDAHTLLNKPKVVLMDEPFGARNIVRDSDTDEIRLAVD